MLSGSAGTRTTTGDQTSQHDGVHRFFVGKNAKVKYVERHYADGDGNGQRVMNPESVVELDEGSYMEMETTQIKGVDSTDRKTSAKLADKATFQTLANVAGKTKIRNTQRLSMRRQLLAVLFPKKSQSLLLR